MRQARRGGVSGRVSELEEQPDRRVSASFRRVSVRYGDQRRSERVACVVVSHRQAESRFWNEAGKSCGGVHFLRPFVLVLVLLVILESSDRRMVPQLDLAVTVRSFCYADISNG